MLLSSHERNATKHVPEGGFYPPVTILVEERPAAYRFIWYLLLKLDRVCQQMKQTEKILCSTGTSLLLRAFPLQRVHLHPTRRKPSGTQPPQHSSMASVTPSWLMYRPLGS